MKAMITPKIKLITPSKIKEIVLVVNPVISVISSDNTCVKTPGALFLSSNQAIYL